MAGFDRRTGRILTNYQSAVQGVQVVLTTRIGERVMLRHFGAGMVDLLGRKMSPQLFGAFQILIVAAIDMWEPRFRVRRISFTGSVEAVRRGQASIDIEVDWRPLGHLGDFTVDSVRNFSLSLANGDLQVAA